MALGRKWKNLAFTGWILMSLFHLFAGKEVITCEGDVFRPFCPDGHFLVFESANYGRTDPTTCLEDRVHDDRICRQKTTLAFLNNRCYGRQACNVTVSEELLGNTCKQEDVSKYLEASYECITDADVTEMCRTYMAKLGDRSSGYIRSRNYPNKYPEKEDCVAKLNAREGYRYRFKILDLEVEARRGTGCYDWLVIQDEHNSRLYFDYCGELVNIHTSEPDAAENLRDLTVSFRSDPRTNARGYLIKYEEHETIPERDEL